MVSLTTKITVLLILPPLILSLRLARNHRVPFFSSLLLAHDFTTAKTSSLSRIFLGPLASIPEPLEDGEMQKIPQALNSFFKANMNISSNNHPVLFVPGLSSSQLETQLHNRQKPYWWIPNCLCPKTTNCYQQVWFPKGYWKFLPFLIDCYVETLLVNWNNTTAKSLPGIDTRQVPTFDSAMELDPNTPTYRYYANLLTKYLNYQPNQQMIAQPWDWRVGPETWRLPGREFDQMKSAIEQTVASNQGQKIVALSISAGGPFFACFLQHVTPEWKQQHIHTFYSVSGAFSGTAIAPLQLLSLRHNSFLPDGIPSYISNNFAKILQSTSSISWLFPNSDSFHNDVVTTPTRAFRANELDQVLNQAGLPQQAELYLANRPSSGGDNLVPGVRTYCLSGYGIPTPSALHYNSQDFQDAPTVDWDEGDNCVTVESLRQCDAWAGRQEAPVYVKHYYNQSHAGLLYDADVIQQFFAVVTGKEDEWETRVQ